MVCELCLLSFVWPASMYHVISYAAYVVAA